MALTRLGKERRQVRAYMAAQVEKIGQHGQVRNAGRHQLVKGRGNIGLVAVKIADACLPIADAISDPQQKTLNWCVGLIQRCAVGDKENATLLFCALLTNYFIWVGIS